MPNLAFYIDLFRQVAVRSPTSAAPAPIPDFRSPALYTVSLYFMTPVGGENYTYQRYSGGMPQLKLRRLKAPDYSTFTLVFLGYRSPTIDARLPLQSIQALIAGMPSIGAGNVQVTGDAANGFTIEFIGDHAGYAQPSFSGTAITPVGGEIVIRQIAAGGGGANAIQTIQLRDAPVAIASGWAETGVPSTPGWAGTLDTTAVSQDVFDRGDLILEVVLDAASVRTGTDGITLSESTTRSGTDGQILAGQTDLAVPVNLVNDTSSSPPASYLVARDGSTVYGRLFTATDVGRSVVDAGGTPFYIPTGATISNVIDQPYYNAAVLSAPFARGLPGTTIQVDIGGAPSKTYKSVSAAFVAADVGHAISGDNIASGTVISQLIDAQTVLLSQAGLLVGTGFAWTVTALTAAQFQLATNNFSPGDVGARIESPALPAGVYITALIDVSNAVLSARALSVASAQPWTIRPLASGFAPPSVVSTSPGTLASAETQQITLFQQPVGGIVQIRDGADVSLPWAQVAAPLNPSGIQSAINRIYQNWGGVQVTELAPNAKYSILWGVYGQQHLLVVDQSQAVFDPVLAEIPVGQQAAAVPAAAIGPVSIAAHTHSLAFRNIDGNLILGAPATGPWQPALSRVLITPTSDGTNSTMLKQRFAQTVYDYRTPNVGESYYNYRLDRHENIEDRGGLRLFDWIGYAQPAARSEYKQQSKSIMGAATSNLNGRVIDVQLFSYSKSTWVREDYQYIIGARFSSLPADGPWAIVVHFVGVGGFLGQSLIGSPWGWQFIPFIGQTVSFPGTAGYFTQSWTRRRWHADIFEQVSFVG